MTWAIVTIFVLLAVSALLGSWLVVTRRRWRRDSGPNRLAEVLRRRLREQAERLPERRSIDYSEYPTFFGASAVEAWLLQRRPHNALAAAVHAVKMAPEDSVAYLYLARALLHVGVLDHAQRALAQSRMLGTDTPAHRYLQACLDWERSRGRGSVGPEQAARVLSVLLEVLDADPRFGEAAMLAAEAARVLGFREEADLLESRGRALAATGADRPLVERLLGRGGRN